MTSKRTAAPSRASNIGDYYSAAQLRSDRWSALKDCAQRLALAAAAGRPQQRLKDDAKALLEALQSIESFWAFPGKANFAHLVECLNASISRSSARRRR